MTSPLLWYLNRGSGLVLLVVFTLTTVLGVLSTGRRFSPLWPRFVTQGLHRSLAAIGTVLLVGHVTTAVVDTYVTITWWQAVVPFGATYKPLYLSLGTVALDLTALIVITSLLRSRLSTRTWHGVHLVSYLAWAVSVVHGVGIGTDASRGWSVLLTLGCVAAVAIATMARVGSGIRDAAGSRA